MSETEPPELPHHAPWGIYTFLLRPDGHASVPTASSGLAALFSVDLEEVARDASPIFARTHPDDLAGLHAAIAASAYTSSAFLHEWRIERPDGEIRWIEARTLPATRDGSGCVLWQGVCQDVTDRHVARRALEAEETRFRQMAGAIREVFWLADATTGQLLYVSPAYEAVWRRSAAELERDILAGSSAVHPDDRARVLEAWRSAAARGHDIEYRIVWPDGSTRWLHDRAFPVHDGAGNPTRLAGITEDVTERRALEDQLRQTQKMESMGRLAGGVAHDFNNLLTAIVGAAELIREEAGERPEILELAGEVLDAARRGASLTRQLLAFTRQEVVEPRVMDLSSVVADAEKLLRRLIGEDVTLATRLDRGAPPVLIDPGQWTQVILNLAVNARDAMPRGGNLLISTGSRRIAAGAVAGLEAGEHTVLEVRDDGLGMTPDVRSRIFEPFFTTKPRGKGTGLGLAVVYGVVHQAHGAITVESTPGQGTTFTILLPAASAPRSTAAAVGARATRGGHELVMLVEDDERVRRLVRRGLTSRGYVVVTARDGLEALQLLGEMGKSPALLVTDVVMPNVDGVELAARALAIHPELKVLFSSGYIDEAITLRGVPSGAAFLQKPYTLAVLAGRIRELLDS